MKKLLIFISIGLIALSVAVKAESSSLQQIPGTNIFIEPPEDFTVSERFMGFQQDITKSSLVVIPLKDVSLADVVDQIFSEERLQRDNMSLIDRENITVNGQEIELLLLEQNHASGVLEKIVRLLPGDDELVILNGIYLKNQKAQVYNALRDAIISAEWRDMPAPEGFEMVDFEFDVAPGWEIREPGLGRLVMLSPVGAPKHSTPMDWPLVIVGPSLDDRTVNNLRASSIDMLKNVKGYEFKSIQSEQSREINGLKSYFIKSNGLDIETSEPLSCWQLLIRGPDNQGYYRVLALGSDLDNDAKALFDTLKDTFRLK